MVRVSARVNVRARCEVMVRCVARIRIKKSVRARVRVKSKTGSVITENTTRIKSPSYLRKNSAMHVFILSPKLFYRKAP